MPKSASLARSGFRGIRGRVIEVPVTTLDIALENTPRADLVKLDIEGFEDCALEGMTQTLRHHRPVLVVENPEGPYRRVDKIMREFGYRFFPHHRRRPDRENQIVPDAT